LGRIEFLKISVFIVTAVIATSSCNSSRTDEIPPFDSSRAFSYLEHQVSLGHRIPGTKSHDDALEWITACLREHTSLVQVQSFKDNYAEKEVTFKNIIASFYPDKTKRVLLCAHWDTRHHADRDPDSLKWTEPVPGANDGASGVAVLLEIASAIAKNEPPVGIDIVFFDGEDGGSYGDNSTWILGSQYFARVMPPAFRPAYALLLDMIGDKDLSLSRDINSRISAPKLWERVENICKSLSIPFLPYESNITDDHIPLIARGIPTIDLIDFDYPYWHTVSDTPDKCSAESLGKIGMLVLTLVYGE
jgi:glutaminyl-peptide cyclotransferase